jgi:hypothetical protein
VTDDVTSRSVESRPIWIVEDEPAAAKLAADLCEASGAEASVFRAPLPFLTARLEILAQQQKLAGGALPILQKFYYELAQGSAPGQLAALLKMVPISQVLYGTDYPFRDGAEVNSGIAAYGFGPDDIRSIEREIAFKLIPRLKQT